MQMGSPKEEAPCCTASRAPWSFPRAPLSILETKRRAIQSIQPLSIDKRPLANSLSLIFICMYSCISGNESDENI